MTDEQHGHYIRALMMADRLIDDGPEKRDWRLSFGRLFEGRRESPIPEDVGAEVEYVLRSRIEAARRDVDRRPSDDTRRAVAVIEDVKALVDKLVAAIDEAAVG